MPKHKSDEPTKKKVKSKTTDHEEAEQKDLKKPRVKLQQK